MKKLKILYLLIFSVLVSFFACKSNDNDCSLGSDEDPKGISFSFTFQTSVALDSIEIKEHQYDTIISVPEVYKPDKKAFVLTDVFPNVQGSKSFDICFPNTPCKTLVLNYSKEDFDDCSVHYDANYNEENICTDCSSSTIYSLVK